VYGECSCVDLEKKSRHIVAATKGQIVSSCPTSHTAAAVKSRYSGCSLSSLIFLYIIDLVIVFNIHTHTSSWIEHTSPRWRFKFTNPYCMSVCKLLTKIQISKPMIHVYVWFKDDMWIWLILNILACSTEYEVCDSFASLTRQQTSYSGSTCWYFRYQSIHIQITYTYWLHMIFSISNIECFYI
jgi:hypothetical protein